MKKKYFGAIFAVSISLLLIIFIFFSIKKYRQYSISLIDNNPATTIGKVVDLSNYKGITVKVEYYVNDVQYILSEGISRNQLESLNIGDSIAVKYEKSNPDNSILE